MPLQQTSGNVTSDAYGGGTAVTPVYIEDVMSTFLYTGNGSTQTITNGIDLSTKGGLVWIKSRISSVYDHQLVDTTRGSTKYINSNLTNAESTSTNRVTAFNTNGFTLAGGSQVNESTGSYASWTFREQPKFFDVVTYTGNGTTQNIAHNLGSAPGCVIVKTTSNAGYNWAVYHRSLSSGDNLRLNTTDSSSGAALGPGGFGDNTSVVAPTSTVFTVGNNGNLNNSGFTYVAYLFAHNAGGFGLTGTENVISCGSFTDTTTVNLGYEPQWVLFKKSSSSSIGDWFIADNMRGFSETSINTLSANTSSAEASYSNTGCVLTSTGFTYNTGLAGSGAFIYIAIRRGPMKVPTDATKVFKPIAVNNALNTVNTTGFPIDLQWYGNRDGNANNIVTVDRLRGVSTTTTQQQNYLRTASTAAEVTSGGSNVTKNWGSTGFWTASAQDGANAAYWNFQRAPSFFDEVCYTGDSVDGRQITHNLGVAPELIIGKRRNSSADWPVSTFSSGSVANRLILNSSGTSSGGGNGTFSASSNTTFTVSEGGTSFNLVNAAGSTYVAYLFATCAGVSKVGSYTGNGSTQTINCGFTGGARFVLIKATSTTGNWMTFDTARGMTTLTDPFLSLNSTAAETATLGACTTVSTGFAVNESILTGVNTSGVSYIFLSVA